MLFPNLPPEAQVIAIGQLGIVKRRDVTIVRFDVCTAAGRRSGLGRVRGLGRGALHARVRRKAGATISAFQPASRLVVR